MLKPLPPIALVARAWSARKTAPGRSTSQLHFTPSTGPCNSPLHPLARIPDAHIQRLVDQEARQHQRLPLVAASARSNQFQNATSTLAPPNSPGLSGAHGCLAQSWSSLRAWESAQTRSNFIQTTGLPSNPWTAAEPWRLAWGWSYMLATTKPRRRPAHELSVLLLALPRVEPGKRRFWAAHKCKQT